MADEPPKASGPEELVTLVPEVLSHIPEGYYAAAGRVASAWATLDFHLDMAIWKLARTPQMLGACVSTQIFSTPSRLRALRALMQLYGAGQERLKFLDKFTQQTHALAVRRNRIVHDPVVVGRTTGRVYRLTVAADRELLFGTRPVHAAVDQGVFEKIKEHAVTFIKFWQEVEPELQASSKTNPLPLYEIAPTPQSPTPQLNPLDDQPPPRSSPE